MKDPNMTTTPLREAPEAMVPEERASPGPFTQLVEAEWQNLCDKDDRTSPEKYPDMCLITRNELAGAMCEALLMEKRRAADEMAALLTTPDTEGPTPVGYRYLYPAHNGQVWRFATGGREINGSRPIRSEAVYSADALRASAAREADLQAKLDAALEDAKAYAEVAKQQRLWKEEAEAKLAAVEGERGTRADEIVTALYRQFKDWSLRGFGPDDVTWCEVKAHVMALIQGAHAAQADNARLRSDMDGLAKDIRAQVPVTEAYLRDNGIDRVFASVLMSHYLTTAHALEMSVSQEGESANG